MYEHIEIAFHYLIKYGVVLLELIGTIIILYSGICAVVQLLRGKKDGIRLSLAQGIALALEFKLGSEVMRTVILDEVNDLIITGAIVLMRAAMTFLIHWEIKNEKADQHELK